MIPNIIQVLSCLFGFLTQCQFSGLQSSEVLTKYGPVIGSVNVSRGGRPFYSFRRIPFAKPPVGNLRFKAPQPPDAWTEPLDAKREAPSCIQKNYLFPNPQVEGEEDCLFINVYAPEGAYNLPVMVFIHWGGFIAGSGASNLLGPEYLMDKDVLLVTFNYRLGPLGFLSTFDDAAPGNYALKDQVLALKWVQENIEYFGGDKSSVTIFGQSAGSASVHYHILSPQSRGLFHKAIAESGSALAYWTYLGNRFQATVLADQARFVGCGALLGDSQKVISCLRNVSAYDLVDSQDQFKVFYEEPLSVYTAVRETQTAANPEPFFTKNPIEYIQSGEFAKVPWILGNVENEGLLKSGLLRRSNLRNDINANFESLMTNVLLRLDLSTNETKALYEGIKKQYLLGNDFLNISNTDSIQGFIDAFSDRYFVFNTYQAAMLHAANGHKPLWFYYFEYRGEYSYGDVFAGTNETIDFDWGTSHCDDLLYLFRSPGIFPDLNKTYDIEMMETMVDMWTAFATYGDPNYSTKLNNTIHWQALDTQGAAKLENENLCLLNVNGSHSEGVFLNTNCGFKKERMSFWSNQSLYENSPDFH